MVVLGFPGVQALDLVGPVRRVHRGVAAAGGRRPRRRLRRVAGVGRRPTRARPATGLDARHRSRCPDPARADRHRRAARRLRHRRGRAPTRASWTGSGRSRPTPAGWSASAPAHSWPPRPACSTAAAPPRTGRSPRQLAREFPAVDVDPEPIFVRSSETGVDGGGRHRGHRPGAGAGRGRLRHRARADGRPLAGAVPAPARRADAVRRAGVDAAGQARADPRGAGGHRGRTRRARTASPISPAAPR